MAPTRKKGANKVASTAAARRQWKVGDLVLAKVKGFPAWPATISEPERWGYSSSDWKKVFVCFFGTQQIAFCNPADVEAFTEEKKQSLLKRQGRGADFVHAVREIIDSYENLKKESQIDKTNSSGEVTGANLSNTADLSADLGLKDGTEAPDLTCNSRMKSSISVMDRHEPISAAEDASTASAAALRDESCDEEASLEEPTDNAVAIEKSPFTVTYASRRRSADSCPHSYVTQRILPAQRLRNSTRVKNPEMPCNDSAKSAGNILASAVQGVSVRRRKLIRKSSVPSGCDDVDLSGLASNGSMEDNDSEIFTIESDTLSLNEGGTIDSNAKLDHSETIECFAREVDLNDGLDHEIKAVVSKKRRKPSRKRYTSDAAKLTATPDEEACLMNTSQSSQYMCGNLKERCFEQEGDEHLPLLKRARVRMGKSLSTETELNGILQPEENRSNEDISHSQQQVITSSKSVNGSPADGDSVELNGDLDNVSPSKNLAPCSESGSQTSKKDQTLGLTLDVEAALPPSKRLHRALEAMSANVAEEGQAQTEASSAIVTSSGSGSCCISSTMGCACMPHNSQGGNGLDLLGVDSCGNDLSHVNLSSSTTSTNPMIFKENKSSLGSSDQVGGDLGDSMVCQTAGTDFQTNLCSISLPNHHAKCCEVENRQDSPDLSLLTNDEDSTQTVNHLNKASDTSEHTRMSVDIVSNANGSVKHSAQNSTDVPLTEDSVCEKTECLKPVSDGSKVNDNCVVVKEDKCIGSGEDMNSASFSDDCLGEKDNLGFRLSPSLTDGGDCLPQGSPPNMSVCNVSTSDSSNVLQNNGSCSPDVHLHQKHSLSVPVVDEQKDRSAATPKSRSMGKSTEAGHAALVYFEAMLGTLTRTKESIGRATRIAMDCAKFGVAAKVVEILVHSLETESSLHRRVDLFFLVDSILKGAVGGVYPSAIQAMLPRLLSAAVPPGSTAQENRRQCLKVLRLWLERKSLPESIILHHIRELDFYSGSASRRTSRTERALHDPVREMEGMLVDEYGSNSSFQLPGFCMPQMRKDEENEGSDSDGENFEAVTPEHDSDMHDVKAVTPAVEKHRHILEDVDGELEMEDVAPSGNIEMNLFCNVDGGIATQASHNQPDKSLPPSFGPPLPQNVPMSSPPPPPPPPPPQPPLHLMSTGSDSYGIPVDSKLYTNAKSLQDNSFHSVAPPLAAPRSSYPISEAAHRQVPDCRDRRMHVPDSSCSFSSFPLPPPDNFQHSGFTNRGYPLRPPHHVPSNQFSFVCGEQHLKPRREVPPPLFSNRHHNVQNMERESFYNNHERLKPSSYDYQERWRGSTPYTGTGHRYQGKGVPDPYGCHPCESTRLPGHGWRFPPRSMNHRNSMPFKPPFEDGISVSSRGPSFFQPR